jgi:hypothetical protein
MIILLFYLFYIPPVNRRIFSVYYYSSPLNPPFNRRGELPGAYFYLIEDFRFNSTI